jgi:hypothetical protein
VTQASLSPGEHVYEDIVAALRSRVLEFATLRSASGRKNHLIGLSQPQLTEMRRIAAEFGVELALYGSRVSGPRIRQRALHPVLARALPLKELARRSSSKYPGASGVEIKKTVIKEFGLEDPRTSDLTELVIDLLGRQSKVMREIGDALEDRFSHLGATFPIRVFAEPLDQRLQSRNDVRNFVARHLNSLLKGDHGFSRRQIAEAAEELFAFTGRGIVVLRWSDLLNGLLAAGTTSLSFSIVLGFHPVVPCVGFLMGLFGRHLARLRAYLCDHGEHLAIHRGLIFDFLFGLFLMACIVNPIAGYGIHFGSVLMGSLLHSVSKGYVRLAIDLMFANGSFRQQALGVLVNTFVAVVLGLITSLAYTGSAWAYAAHLSIFILGVGLVRHFPAQQRI